MKPLPSAFLARMQRLLADEFPAFAACYDQPACSGLRVNTLKLPVEQAQARLPFSLVQVAWCPAGFLVPEADEARPGRHPFHAAGLYYLQEPSAMAVAQVLDPQPGERVLDLAAAPGGKATHIASLMRDEGLLWANEIRTKRIPSLVSNLERWGVRSAVVTNETPERLADRFPAFFERVLVDAPCSGEGMFRRDEAVRLEWDAAHIAGYADRQRRILQLAARLVRPGGVLVYATCTFAPEENEAVIASFLQENGQFAFDPLPDLPPGLSPARPEWVQAVCQGAWSAALRIWPHRAPGEGHFIARLRRLAGEQIPPPLARRPHLPPTCRAPMKAFFSANLKIDVPEGDLLLRGAQVYRMPADVPDLSALRLPRPGWWLGDLRKDRFEPAHALALALNPHEAQRVVDLPASSAEVRGYLRGEPLPVAGLDGWTLVTVDGFPLGWGKQVKGVLKNHYPPGLRMV